MYVNRQELEERYGGKLTKQMSGSLYEVFSKVMRALVGKKITVPGPFKKLELYTHTLVLNYSGTSEQGTLWG